MSPYVTCVGCNRCLFWPDELKEREPLCVDCEIKRTEAEGVNHIAVVCLPPDVGETVESRGEFDEGEL